MSYRYERYRERPRSAGRRWLISLTIIVWLLVAGFLAVRFFVRPRVTDYVNRKVVEAVNPQASVDANPGEALRESLQQIPINVAIKPGKIRVTEDDANEYLYAYRQKLKGIDNVRVRFVPGEVQADVTASIQGFAVSSTARAQPVVENGRIVARNAALDQPLGSVLSIDSLMNALVNRINDELAAQGRRVTGIRVEQGVAVIEVE